MDFAVRAISLLDRRRGLYLRGLAMGLEGRRADLADYWQDAALKFPSDAVFVRQAIHSALGAGRLADADREMTSLVRARATQVGDCRFVVGLANAYRQSGRQAALRRLVRAFLKSLQDSSQRRIATLKLSRVIFANFRRTPDPDVVREQARLRRQLGRMVERSIPSAGPRAILERVLTTEGALAGRASLTLFDTDVSQRQCRAFVHLVRIKLVSRSPFSLVRIGDGEAACLPYEPKLARLAKADSIDRERIWWGKPLTRSQRERLSRLVFNATWGADCIGIPTASRYLRELRLGENDNLDRGLTGRGLRAILYAVENCGVFCGPGTPLPAFTSCHIHQDLERWGLYDELLDGLNDVVLVSCHTDLADLMQTRFGTGIAANLILPPDRVSAPAMTDAPRDARRLPDILDEVVDRMRGIPRDKLVLVGAGYLGKWLVDVARAEGGIALDVGSVFDYWLGLNTRSYLDLIPIR